MSRPFAAPAGVTERPVSPDGSVVLRGPGYGPRGDNRRDDIADALELRLYGRNYPDENEALNAGRI